MYHLQEASKFDEVCTLLTCHPTFLSNFHQLNIEFLDCEGPLFLRGSGTQTIFDKLITTYFSAFTVHSQKMHFSGMKIAAYVALRGLVGTQTIFDRLITTYFSGFTVHSLDNIIHFSGIKYDTLNIDPCYLHFKNIEMHDLLFVATTSYWPGHDFSVQKSSNDGKSYYFRSRKREEADYGKRKHFEIDSDDST